VVLVRGAWLMWSHEDHSSQRGTRIEDQAPESPQHELKQREGHTRLKPNQGHAVARELRDSCPARLLKGYKVNILHDWWLRVVVLQHQRCCWHFHHDHQLRPALSISYPRTFHSVSRERFTLGPDSGRERAPERA
jgi:hypothetical protein